MVASFSPGPKWSTNEIVQLVRTMFENHFDLGHSQYWVRDVRCSANLLLYDGQQDVAKGMLKMVAMLHNSQQGVQKTLEVSLLSCIHKRRLDCHL